MELAKQLKLHKSLQLSAIKNIELAASKIPGAISLAQGIPSFPTPSPIIEFVQQKISEGKCDKYSLCPGLLELREIIAHNLEEMGLCYDPFSEIIITAGSIEAITATLLGCTSPGGEVIVPSPTYVSYIGAIKLAHCTPVFFELDEENNFDLNLDKITAAITSKTQAIFYCNPNNPTGTTYSEVATARLLEIAKAHNLIIITDEAYQDFYYNEGERHFSPAMLEGGKDRVVRICTFSKSYAMTGWRIGYLHTNEDLAQRILGCHDSMVTCATVASQYGAIAALTLAKDYPRHFCNEYKKRRDLLIAKLDQLSPFLDYQMPKAAYFVFPRVKDTVPLARSSWNLAYDILEKAGLALVPGSSFGPSGEAHLRISFSRDSKDVEEGIERLTKYFNQKAHSSKIFSVPAPQKRSTPSESTAKLTNPTKRLAIYFLGTCARLYIKKTKPIIIGVVGLKGKTIIKRAIASILAREENVRSSFLSYNTEIGLPLSVLNVALPKTILEKLMFPFKILRQLIFNKDAAKILVLEYGIRTKQDAAILTSIAPPTWIVLGNIDTSDTPVGAKEFLEGIALIMSGVDSQKILWLPQIGIPDKIKSKLKETNKIDLKDINRGKITIDGDVYEVKLSLPGETYKISALAGVMLAKRLAISDESVKKYLDPNYL